MDFVTSLPISANLKSDSYNLIFDIVDQLTKMVYYIPVKITINVPNLVEVIINIIIYYYGVLKLIVMNQSLFFISKF